MVFGYAPLGSGGMSYCNQTPFFLSVRVGSGHKTTCQEQVSNQYSQSHECLESCLMMEHSTMKSSRLEDLTPYMYIYLMST